MEGIYWAWTRVQYRAVLISELANTLYVEKTGNFLICQLLKSYSYIMTRLMYRSEQYWLYSRQYLNVCQ